MNILEFIEQSAETKGFHIEGKRGRNTVIDIIISGSKLYDISDEYISFFDSDSGIEIEIYMLLHFDFVNNKIECNSYSIETIDDVKETIVTINPSEKNKTDEYNIDDVFFVML